MTPELNHTIVWCSDKHRSSQFLAEMLGMPAPRAFMHFEVIDLGNGVSLDYYQKDGAVSPQHYAFLVDDAGFDAGLALIRERKLAHWADPARTEPNTINTRWGGRGVYFEDPDGHLMELITRPYGDENQP